jgi:hypothetical protein
MNRGKLSHFTLFAFSLWISIFFAGALPGALFPITGLVCVAAALVLAAMEKPRLKRTGLVLGCLGLAAFIGGIRVPEVTRWDRYPPLLPVSSSYTAIPPDRVGQFRGFLVADSTAVAGSAEPLSRCAVKLEQVVSADGQQRGPAAGCILVWIRSGRMLFRGEPAGGGSIPQGH